MRAAAAPPDKCRGRRDGIPAVLTVHITFRGLSATIAVPSAAWTRARRHADGARPLLLHLEDG